MDMNFICENVFFLHFCSIWGLYWFLYLIGLVREQRPPGVQGPPHAEAFPLSFCVSHLFPSKIGILHVEPALENSENLTSAKKV